MNVSEEQIDLAIEDAFQYFNERSHFLGTENLYLTTRMTSEFVRSFASFRVQEVSQVGTGKEPIPGRAVVHQKGMVAELTLVSPGAGYITTNSVNVLENTTELNDLDITTDDSVDITTETGDDIVYETSGSNTGSDLTVVLGEQRTVDMGITNVSIYNAGSNYEVGDIVSIMGTNKTADRALFHSPIECYEPLLELGMMLAYQLLLDQTDYCGVGFGLAQLC